MPFIYDVKNNKTESFSSLCNLLVICIYAIAGISFRHHRQAMPILFLPCACSSLFHPTLSQLSSAADGVQAGLPATELQQA